MGLMPRAPSRILLIGLGAGQLVELWRTHLPRAEGATLDIHCVELHGEVVELARQHFAFGRADDTQTTTTVQVADGRVVLEQLPPSVYDLVVVDLSVAGFVDTKASADLRRVLRPGGVCVHNYNFSSGREGLGALPMNFVEVHQLVIDASNTILVSTTEACGTDDFSLLVDAAVAFPYASPLLFDLRSVRSSSLFSSVSVSLLCMYPCLDPSLSAPPPLASLCVTSQHLEAVAYDRAVAGESARNKTDLATRCEPVMNRGSELLERVQVVGGVFTLKRREGSQQLTEMRGSSKTRPTPTASNASAAEPEKEQEQLQASSTSSSASSPPSSTVEVVQQVLLRKVLAVDRGQAATVSHFVVRHAFTSAIVVRTESLHLSVYPSVWKYMPVYKCACVYGVCID